MALRFPIVRSSWLLRNRPFFEDSDFERLFIQPYWGAQSNQNSQKLGDVVENEVNVNNNQVSVDVSQFKPEEIKVNVIDDQLIIEGKHEEKSEKHGQIQRHFIRKYTLPKGVRADQVKSELNGEGVLSIKYEKAQDGASTSIPITFTKN